MEEPPDNLFIWKVNEYRKEVLILSDKNITFFKLVISFFFVKF